MPCFQPLDVPRPESMYTGRVQSRYMQVPCGRCVGCKLERARNHTIRIMHESQMHEHNSFLTLTYSDNHLVRNYSNATLVPEHLQLFWKRLRKELSPTRIRYFACGEYGSRRSRPHYHACLFGYNFPDKTLFSSEGGNNLYTSNLLNRIWSHGNCIIGNLTPNTAAYVARYIVDKFSGHESTFYDELGITPEFVTMSRRPGIGASWFERFSGDIYPHDQVVLEGGVKSRPPRYYDKLFSKENPVQLDAIKLARLEAAEENLEEKTPKRLKAREKHANLVLKNLQRKLH